MIKYVLIIFLWLNRKAKEIKDFCIKIVSSVCNGKTWSVQGNSDDITPTTSLFFVFFFNYEIEYDENTHIFNYSIQSLSYWFQQTFLCSLKPSRSTGRVLLAPRQKHFRYIINVLAFRENHSFFSPTLLSDE